MQEQKENHVGRKILIFSLLFLVFWNISKIPFYIAFDVNDGKPLAAHINLEHYIKGFRGKTLRSPPCNFLLLHVALGSTVLVMMVLSLIKPALWRKKYAKYFFAFALCLAIHTLPASLSTPTLGLRILYTFDCVFVIVVAIFGYKTLYDYDKNSVLAEKRLFLEYCLITFGACGAGFVEGIVIFFRFRYKWVNGYYQSFGDEPDPLYGKNPFNKLPEKYGMWLFFIFTAIFWVWWPLRILEIDLKKPNATKTALTDEEIIEAAQ